MPDFELGSRVYIEGTLPNGQPGAGRQVFPEVVSADAWRAAGSPVIAQDFDALARYSVTDSRGGQPASDRRGVWSIVIDGTARLTIPSEGEPCDDLAPDPVLLHKYGRLAELMQVVLDREDVVLGVRDDL